MPDHPDLQGLLDKAIRLESEGQTEEAKQVYEAFLALKPDHLGVRVNYAALLLGLQQWEGALEACQEVLKLAPGFSPALLNQSQALMNLGRIEEAEFHIRSLLRKEPRNVNALLTLADICMKKEEWSRACKAIEQIMEIQPSNPPGQARLHNIAIHTGDWANLRKGLERQLESFSGAELEYERGYMKLLFGQMPEGWDGYEQRLLVPNRFQPVRSFDKPRWNGEPFKGKTLLVQHEQGFGDTIMFSRYLPQVKALGGRLILLVQPGLAELMATCAGADQVLVDGDPLPPFDFVIPLPSLPRVFRTDLSTIPADIPYLSAPEQAPNRKVISELLGLAQRRGLARIGLVWAGNPAHKRDAERSIPVEALAPLASLPGVAWFSLQKGRSELPALPRLVDLSPLLTTFGDTASALAEMDLLISVDTSVAHLAGALGVQTLLLLAFQPDFRWLLKRDDSPWYPSLRLYRQPIPEDWNSVVQQVLADLSR